MSSKPSPSGPNASLLARLGLDQHYAKPDQDIQIASLEGQLERISRWRTDGLAKPIVIHCRKATADLIPRLNDSGLPADQFVFHCFTGTPDEARAGPGLRSMDFLHRRGDVPKRPRSGPSRITGPQRSHHGRDRRTVHDTSPPPQHQTQRTQVRGLCVCEALAKIQGCTPQAMEELLDRNAERFFGITLPDSPRTRSDHSSLQQLSVRLNVVNAPSPRVVSLLPAATEWMDRLGATEHVVGRSHACNTPSDISHVPCVTRPTTTGGRWTKISCCLWTRTWCWCKTVAVCSPTALDLPPHLNTCNLDAKRIEEVLELPLILGETIGQKKIGAECVAQLLSIGGVPSTTLRVRARPHRACFGMDRSTLCGRTLDAPNDSSRRQLAPCSSPNQVNAPWPLPPKR